MFLLLRNNIFLTENEYDYRARPLKIDPDLDRLIKKSKQVPKEEKLKKSKLVSAVRGMTQNRILLHFNERIDNTAEVYAKESDHSSIGKSNIISSSDY